MQLASNKAVVAAAEAMLHYLPHFTSSTSSFSQL